MKLFCVLISLKQLEGEYDTFKTPNVRLLRTLIFYILIEIVDLKLVVKQKW